jgi:hypothetical protein
MTLPTSRAWEKADALWSAVEKYSPVELWNRYVELGMMYQEGSEPSYFFTPPLADGTMPSSDSPLGGIMEQRVLLREIKSAFIRMLTELRLSSVGYEMPRRRGDKPVWIASECWKDSNINWDRSELHCAQSSYQDVRIVPSRETRDEARRILKAHAEGSEPSKRGRSTREPEIIAAWDALVAAGEVPNVRYLSTIFDVVRRKLHKMFDREKPDNDGLGNKVLYRVLSPLWKAHRSEFKNSINSL